MTTMTDTMTEMIYSNAVIPAWEAVAAADQVAAVATLCQSDVGTRCLCPQA